MGLRRHSPTRPLAASGSPRRSTTEAKSESEALSSAQRGVAARGVACGMGCNANDGARPHVACHARAASIFVTRVGSRPLSQRRFHEGRAPRRQLRKCDGRSARIGKATHSHTPGGGLAHGVRKPHAWRLHGTAVDNGFCCLEARCRRSALRLEAWHRHRVGRRGEADQTSEATR